MNRAEFMRQLERLLRDIPENDRLDAIAYYNDYFDEAGIENEAKVIQKLGSPGKVAAIIKADLNANGYEHGQYTEMGFSDGHVNPNTPSRRETGYQEPKQKRKIPLAVLIILIVFASPVLLGVGGGLLGGLIGLLAGALGIILAAILGGVSLLIAGIVCLIVGIVRIVFTPLEGIVTVGIGAILAAVGILMILLFVWSAFKWFPALFRTLVNWFQRVFHKGERRNVV